MRAAVAVLLLGALAAGCTHPSRPESAATTSTPTTAAPMTASSTRGAPTTVTPTHAPPTKAAPTTAPPTTARPTTPASTPAPTKPTPPQRPSSIQPVTAAQLGDSWHPGCPVGPAGLRLIRVGYLGFDGHRHEGRLVVAAPLATQVVAIFAQLYADRFPIRRMAPVSAYDGDDERSMEADNSSAFNCRAITGGSGWSKHAYGTAIDLNTLENPYVSAAGVQPSTAGRFTDRDRTDPGMIHSGDRIVRIFARYGWSWGGAWVEPRDYQHFQT